MKHLITAIIVTLTGVFAPVAAMAQNDNHRVVAVGDFIELKVTDGVNVVYSANADSAGMAVFSAPQDIANGLIFRNNGKTLTIELTGNIVSRQHLPTLYLHSSWLLKVRNESDSTVRVTRNRWQEKFKAVLADNGKVVVEDVDVDKLELRVVTGRGTITARGRCRELNARNLGTGVIQADELQATEVRCRIMGTGTIGCNLTGGELRVRGAGTGKVYYRGEPSKVTVRKVGSIAAIKL